MTYDIKDFHLEAVKLFRQKVDKSLPSITHFYSNSYSPETIISCNLAMPQKSNQLLDKITPTAQECN